VHPDLSLQLKFKVISDQPIEEQTKTSRKKATATPEEVEPAQEADAEIKDVDGDDEA